MYCATKTIVKVCTSLTTTGLSSAAASCGSYQLIEFPVISTATACAANDIQLLTAREQGELTASPWVLTNANAGLIVAAVLLIWAVGYSFRSIAKAINSGSPE
jgi:hypothetical protein